MSDKVYAVYAADQLTFAAYARCECGAGMACPKDSGPRGYWDCSDILMGKAIPSGQEGAKRHSRVTPHLLRDQVGEPAICQRCHHSTQGGRLMLMVYKVKLPHPAPIPVMREKLGWPNRDVDGDMMFTNSHFATEAEAWEHLLREAEAGQSVCCLILTDLKRQVEEATRKAADAACTYVAVKDGYRHWQGKEDTHADTR